MNDTEAPENLWLIHDTTSCGIKSPGSILQIFATAGHDTQFTPRTGRFFIMICHLHQNQSEAP